MAGRGIIALALAGFAAYALGRNPDAALAPRPATGAVTVASPPPGPVSATRYFRLIRQERVRKISNGDVDHSAVIGAGSCVEVETARLPLSGIFTKIAVSGQGASMKIGNVPTDALELHELQPEDNVGCYGTITATPDPAAPLPLPLTAGREPPLPPHGNLFRDAPFYIVTDEVRMRDQHDKERAPFLIIRKGSCVQRFGGIGDTDNDIDFARVTTFDTGRGGKSLTGWLQKNFLRPAIGQSEQSCTAETRPVPASDLPIKEYRLP